MHLIACNTRLFVEYSMFFSRDFSQLVKSYREKKCIGIINDVQFITHIHAVKYAFDLQNRWSHSQSWWCASFQCSFKCTHTITSIRSHSHVLEGNPRWRYKDVLQVQHCSTISIGGMHLFNIHLHSIVCPHRSIIMFKRLNPDTDVLQVQHHSHLLLEFTRSWLSLNNIAPGVIWMCSFIDYLSLNYIVLRSPILYLIIFLCPPLIWILFVFLLGVHCIAPRCLNFSRSVEKSWCHFCRGFHRLNRCSSLFDNLSCFGIKSHISKVMSIQV